MSSSQLDTSRLLRESIPVAAILSFWLFFGRFVHPIIANGLLRAGVVMALLYTVGRGISLTQAVQSTAQTRDIRDTIKENIHVAIPAGAWFLVAALVYQVEDFWNTFALPGLDTSPADYIALVFTGAGVAVVLLYAIATGLSRLNRSEFRKKNDGNTVSSGDD